MGTTDSSKARGSGASLWRRVGRAGLWLSSGLGLLFLLVTFIPIDYWWATLLAGPWEAPRGRVLIVLGGSSTDYGTIGGSSYWRAVYAWRAWQQGGFEKIVISGGGPPGNSTAEEVGRFLAAQGVPRGAMQHETRARTTRENAVLVRELLAQESGPLVLLTSDYHMYRARRCFERAGLEVRAWPYPDVRKRETRLLGRWPAFLDLVSETAKIAYYKARGWI